MRYDRNLNSEWGYVAPAPSLVRTARLIAIAAIIGATAGAVTVFSLLDRPVAEESVAARTLVAPEPKRPVTTSTSTAAQRPSEPQEVKPPAETQYSAEQKVPSVGAAGPPRPQPGELPTTPTPQPPTSATALAEAPAVKAPPSAQTFNDTIAVAPDPAPKPQSKKPRMTARSRTDSSRYYPRGYDRYFDRPRRCVFRAFGLRRSEARVIACDIIDRALVKRGEESIFI